MGPNSRFSTKLAVAVLLLAVLVRTPIFAQYLTVTSSPDPNRIEPGVTTVKVLATAPKLPWIVPSAGKAYSVNFQVDVWFRKPGSGYEWRASSWYFFQSPLKTALEPYGTVTFDEDFPVPSDTPPGKRNGSVALMGGGNTCCPTYEVVFLDIVPPKLHPGNGPVSHRSTPPVISPPPIQKPPKEEPRPYAPREPAGGVRSKPPASDTRAAALSAPPRAIQSGERLTLQDGRVLVMRGSALVLLGRTGDVLRSYPPRSIAFVNAGGDVNVRSGETNEPLGIVQK